MSLEKLLRRHKMLYDIELYSLVLCKLNLCGKVVRYVVVQWIVFLVIHLLLITLVSWNSRSNLSNCMMEHRQQKSDSLLFRYGYWKCVCISFLWTYSPSPQCFFLQPPQAKRKAYKVLNLILPIKRKVKMKKCPSHGSALIKFMSKEWSRQPILVNHIP